VIDHIGINCADYPKSQEFYDAVLGVLGFSRQLDFGRAIGYGRDKDPIEKATSRFRPPTKTRYALSTGRRWNGVPSRCMSHACGPNITPDFGAFVRDPDGNDVEAVWHGARNVAGMSNTDAGAAQELLRDAFTRLIEHVDDLTDGLTDEMSGYRPTPNANSIAWLIWHSARVQDIQLADVAGVEQVWTRDGWVDRFGLELPRNDTGYGHGPDDVAKVRAPADLLSGYYHAVHKLTLEYIASVTASELSRVVDTNWDPPVTASARLVSIVDDCAQHLGQAAYLQGITQ
jgi:Protein of unknown function (DUF664)